MNSSLLVKYFLKLARNPFKEKEIYILERNIGKFIHFTSSDKLGTNYKRKIMLGGRNPLGVYGFKLTNEIFQKIINKNEEDKEIFGFGFESLPYIYIFDVKGNVLTEENCNVDDLVLKYYDIICKKYKLNENQKKILDEEIYDSDYNEENTKIKKLMRYVKNINDIIRKKYDNMSFDLTKFFLYVGIDAIEVDNESFEDEIQYQFIVFNPKSLIVIDKIDNPLIINKYKEHRKTSNDNLEKLIEKTMNIFYQEGPKHLQHIYGNAIKLEFINKIIKTLMEEKYDKSKIEDLEYRIKKLLIVIFNNINRENNKTLQPQFDKLKNIYENIFNKKFIPKWYEH